MATNKLGTVKSVEQFMSDYVPVYSPIYPLLMGKSRSYSEQVGKMDFRRMEAVGDIRAKHLLPKDTEISQISVKDGTKSFKKYFLGNQFIISTLQDQEGTEGVVSQVLDEHQKQFDEMVLLGEGEDAASTLNNGLYWSNDSNYVLETSAELPSANGYFPGLHSNIITAAAKADRISGRKLIVFYGSTVLPLWNGIYSTSSVPFKSATQQILGTNYSMAQLPTDITPAGESGYMIINLDQVMLHYTTLPALKKQGTNEEKEYNWFNFLMGSAMLEVLASSAVIRQPLTLAP